MECFAKRISAAWAVLLGRQPPTLDSQFAQARHDLEMALPPSATFSLSYHVVKHHDFCKCPPKWVVAIFDGPYEGVARDLTPASVVHIALQHYRENRTAPSSSAIASRN
jgi:hypothetical protein